MSDIPSARQFIQLEAAQFRSAVSENLVQSIGASANYLTDTTDILNAAIKTKLTSVQELTGTNSSFTSIVYTAPSDVAFVLVQGFLNNPSTVNTAFIQYVDASANRWVFVHAPIAAGPPRLVSGSMIINANRQIEVSIGPTSTFWAVNIYEFKEQTLPT